MEKKYCDIVAKQIKLQRSEILKPNTFLYFAYGGNILTCRMHMHSPSAKFVSIGRVDNYRMDFIRYTKFWGGPSSTLVPTANAHAWGVIWRVNKEDHEALDKQQQVEEKKHYRKILTVQTPHMYYFTCRAYIQKVNPLPRGDNDPIPIERWPSRTYRKVLIIGCIEQGLPDYYINYLRKFKNNGEEGCLRMVLLTRRYADEEPCECKVPGRIPRIPLKLNLNKIRALPRPKKTKSPVSPAKTKTNVKKQTN